MIRESKFLVSKRPYAVDLTGMVVKTRAFPDGRPYHQVTIPAVWFRRRRGVTVACIGELWDGFTNGFTEPAPVDALVALARMTDGRYGGNCYGRWDGQGYWGVEPPSEVAEHLAVLRPMLEDYPTVPEGYDGWWRYA